MGRNESGKTTLLKAFHKFNPATPEPYDPQREFPRDRYTRDFVATGSNGGDWPVCSVRFDLPKDVKQEIAALLESEQEMPSAAILTRFYDGSLLIEYKPSLAEIPLSPNVVTTALAAFAGSARRLAASTPEEKEATAAQRATLASCATSLQDKLKEIQDLRNPDGHKLLAALRQEAESKSSPQTADMIEALLGVVTPLHDAAKAGAILDRVDGLVEN